MKTPTQLCVIEIDLTFLEVIKTSLESDILCGDISQFDLIN